jgi:hypothetical protein
VAVPSDPISILSELWAGIPGGDSDSGCGGRSAADPRGSDRAEDARIDHSGAGARGHVQNTYLFIVDKRMEFWPAMQASHNVVKNDDFGFTMFLSLAFFVNVLGFLCLIVGLLVTVPVTFAAITIAYKELVGSISGRWTVDRRSYLRSGSAKTYSALPVAG